MGVRVSWCMLSMVGVACPCSSACILRLVRLCMSVFVCGRSIYRFRFCARIIKLDMFKYMLVMNYLLNGID